VRLLLEYNRNDNALPGAPPQKAVLYCPLPGEVRYLKWWLAKYLADPVHSFHMNVEMGYDERTEIQLKFQD